MNKKEIGIGEMAYVDAVMNEDLAAAESSIHDMDMAKEMMQSIKNDILLRPSEAMLAQASNLTQDATNLLE